MYAPIPLVLAAPMTLALRALPAGRGPWSARRLLLRFLHSRFLAVVSSMPMAVGLFVFSLFGLYFTPLFSILMSHPWGMLGMQVHFLATGYLFSWTLIGPDPGPHRPPALARLLMVLPVGAAHAFFAATVAFASHPIPGHYLESVRPAWSNLAWDQELGGAVAGGLAEVPMLLLAVVLFLNWFGSLERRLPGTPTEVAAPEALVRSP
jgi:cytochrome c oxidase assembly factor CtaG